MYVFIFYLSSDNRVAAYWEIAAHSAYNMFSMHKYLIVNLVFPTLGVRISFRLLVMYLIAMHVFKV